MSEMDRRNKPATHEEDKDRCKADLGDGIACALRKNHAGLHGTKLPNGRWFEWG